MSRKLGTQAAYTDATARQLVDSVLSDLRARKTNVRCNEMRGHLEKLGYTLTPGKCEGHKIVTHHALVGFTTTSYDCGHAKNGIIKLPYTVKIIRAISDFQEGLISYLKDPK